MRTLGSTFGVAVTGTVLNNLLLINASSGLEAGAVSTVNKLLDPVQRHLIPPEQLLSSKYALAAAIHGTFWLILVLAFAGLAASLFLPRLADNKTFT
jgi:hypothetical protein